MITEQQSITDLQEILIRKQWNAIHDNGAGVFSGSRERMIEMRVNGSYSIQTIVPKAGITSEDLSACSIAISKDSRLAFLMGLPEIIRFWSTFGDSLGKSIYSSPDNSFKEVTASIGMFVRILDNLIDDAPDLIKPELPRLLKLLDKKSWEQNANMTEVAEGKNPALVLLYKFLSYGVGQVKGSAYWKSDESFAVRDSFSTSVELALTSEYQTADCTIKQNSEMYDSAMRTVFERKSESLMYVVALVPITVTGWPEQLDHPAFETSMKNFGRLIGWLGDLSDLRDDLRLGNWSEAIIDIYEWSGKPDYSSDVEWSEKITEALKNDLIVEQLVSKGVNIYRQTLKGFETIGTDPLPLQQFVSDITIMWLSPITSE